MTFPFITVLKVFKYFNWSDKKLHSVIYQENKDEISENLLSDFLELKDGKSNFTEPKLLGSY